MKNFLDRSTIQLNSICTIQSQVPSWTVGRSGFLGMGVSLLLGELGELGESWGWVYRLVASALMGESGDP